MVQGQLTYDPTARLEVTTTEVIYKDDGKVALPMTIFQPSGDGPFPALVRTHGGQWNLGSVEGAARIDRALAECGMVVVAMEHRRAPEYPYPAQVADANAAIRWLKAHAAEYKIDANCVGSAGDSSGAHTTLLNALQPDNPLYADGGDGDGSVAFVIAMWGVLDPYTRYFHALDVGREDIVEHTMAYFLTTEAMRQANPTMMAERRDPIHLPPVLIIQGDTDDNIPKSLPWMFVDAYQSVGGDVQIEWFPGMPHRFAIPPGEEADRAVEIMRAFVAKQVCASTQ
ncbi:MAG: alpha/beta hydrolase [Chloroflexi bacterium]|nr:alpha/beta hydrolase [Chloroflexota bacterium]